jgi:hypothetical protein
VQALKVIAVLDLGASNTFDTEFGEHGLEFQAMPVIVVIVGKIMLKVISKV